MIGKPQLFNLKFARSTVYERFFLERKEHASESRGMKTRLFSCLLLHQTEICHFEFMLHRLLDRAIPTF
ncbi:hypothetical protein HanPI659440_Chr03g0127361 [Helianthus annuus]|nr:hypothetical protein HanPI659440_Chr03g0127361 [Helianthus annuus]